MISRAYYGAFNIAEAVIKAKAYPIDNVKDHGVTWRCLKTQGTTAEQEAADLGIGLMRWRKWVDYHDEFDGDLEAMARAAVKRAKEICRKLGHPVAAIVEAQVLAPGTPAATPPATPAATPAATPVATTPATPAATPPATPAATPPTTPTTPGNDDRDR